MQRSGRPWLANLSLAAGSLLVSLLVLEGAARLARRHGGPLAGGTNFTEYTEYDPLLGWRKRAGAHVTFRRREYTVDLSINRHGQRDSEREYEARPGTFRVLALGDSYVEGYAVPLDLTGVHVLEASLDRDDCRVEALNAGTVGYGTDQEYLFYQTEGVRYAPQVVVLFFYYNDVLYNDMQRYMGGVPKPVFVFRRGSLELYKAPVPRPTPTPAPRADERDTHDESSWALVAWIQERLWFGAPRAYNALGRLGLWPPNRPLGARLELRVYERRRIPEIEGGWEKTGALLRAMSREVETRGSRFLVVYIPSRMEVSASAWRLSQVENGMDEKGWDRGLVLHRLQAIGGAAGFPVLDLTPALRGVERGMLGGPYYTQDGHWNALGHRVAAGEVERFLRERGWLPACAARR